MRKNSITLLTIILTFTSCMYTSTNNLKLKYSHQEPDYEQMELVSTSDTISFELPEDAYNSIVAFNKVSMKNSDYLCLFDTKSMSINLYNVENKQIAQRLMIKKLIRSRDIRKSAVYYYSQDSIFIIGEKKIFLLDSSGIVKDSIIYEDNKLRTAARFETDRPVFLKNNMLFVGSRISHSQSKTLDGIKATRILYEFDLHNKTVNQRYELPKIYSKELYGGDFIDYSYCVDGKGNTVFSFPADSNVYQTDLETTINEHYGQSEIRNFRITPVPATELTRSMSGFKSYLMRNSYGPIYYDPKNKRYIRTVKLKISEEEFNANVRQKKQRITIFDENFKIIGESDIDNGISLGSVFITTDGKIYGRVKREDEYAVHFVRMEYQLNPKSISSL